MKERRAYIVLVAISVGLSVALWFAFTTQIRNNNRAWCDIIIASLPAKAPVNPTNPKVKNYAELKKHYTDYQIVFQLGHRLSCF
jgi:hypothetical protein